MVADVVPANDGFPCEDGLFCTVGETCKLGSCMGGFTMQCPPSPLECFQSVCDEFAQGCLQSPVLDGTRRTGDGYYESVVLDPEGNRLELTV